MALGLIDPKRACISPFNTEDSLSKDKIMLGENSEEVETEDKNIENFIITKTQLRKVIKKDGLAYVLLVQEYNPNKDAVLADNQEHMSRGKLFPSTRSYHQIGSTHPLQGKSSGDAEGEGKHEPYSSHVTLIVGKDKEERPRMWRERFSFGSGRSLLNSVTEEELKTVEHPCARELIKKYKDVFNIELPPGPPPKRDIEFKVDLVEGAVPKNATPYRLAPVEREELN